MPLAPTLTKPIARYLLLALFVLIAGLQMAKVHLWPLSTHGADFVCPAWLHLESRRGKTFLRHLGLPAEKPLRLAVGIFALCLLWELGQLGHSIPGTYDPYDLLAYFLGAAAAYGLDR